MRSGSESETNILEVLHFVVLGRVKKVSYFVIFIDDATGKVWAPLHEKQKPHV